MASSYSLVALRPDRPKDINIKFAIGLVDAFLMITAVIYPINSSIIMVDMIISDSSPLIFLTRLGKIGYIFENTDQILIPKAVYEEVVLEGKRNNFMESNIIENFINEGKIVVNTVKTFNESLYPPLGRGELESLELAKELGLDLIIDDKKVRNVASIFGIKFQTTIVTIFELLVAKTIGKLEYKTNIKKIAEDSWISTDIIEEYLEKGEKFG
jgi:predicted nucleic acid-binding protein